MSALFAIALVVSRRVALANGIGYAMHRSDRTMHAIYGDTPYSSEITAWQCIDGTEGFLLDGPVLVVAAKTRDSKIIFAGTAS